MKYWQLQVDTYLIRVYSEECVENFPQFICPREMSAQFFNYPNENHESFTNSPELVQHCKSLRQGFSTLAFPPTEINPFVLQLHGVF